MPDPAVTAEITLRLVERADEALQALMARTGMCRTDLLNRAATLYEFVDAELRDGRQLPVRDSKTGETWQVKLL